MGIVEAFVIALGLVTGLDLLGREIRVGLVEAAKVRKGDAVVTPDAD